ncbi:hypothetical protein [Desulfitispora alkaliphila]
MVKQIKVNPHLINELIFSYQVKTIHHFSEQELTEIKPNSHVVGN